jgi:flagellar assembly protein FliH
MSAGVVSFRATLKPKPGAGASPVAANAPVRPATTPGAVAAPAAAAAPASAANGGDPTPSAAAALLASLSAAELKDLQRRAYERGADLTRGELAQRFDRAMADLERTRAALEEERRALREAAGGFVVELALGLAEEMLGAALRDGRHDVRALVEAATKEALPIADAGPLTASLHPDDLAELEQALALRPLSLARDVELRADPALKRGACRVSSGGAEVSADPAERFKTAAARVRAAAAKLYLGGGDDPL